MFFRKETSYQPIIDDSESAIQIVHHGAVPKTGKTMKMWFTFFLCLLLPTAVFASDNGAKIVYDGGSLQGVKAGNEVKLYIEGDKIRVKNGKEEIGLSLHPPLRRSVTD